MANIVTRSEWKARRPRSIAKIRSMPTRELWLHHTAGAQDEGGNGFFGDDLRSIQNFHMDSRGWSDIAYSYLVDMNGVCYEGRGPGVTGGHTQGRNSISHAICAIGNYEVHRPQAAMLEGIANMVAHGILAGWWSTDITGPHKAAPGASTSCCGKYLIAEIPHINVRAAQIIRALKSTPIEVEDKVKPQYVLDPILPLVDDLACPTGGTWVLSMDGGVFAFGGAPFLGSPVNKPYWINAATGAPRKASRIELRDDTQLGYVVISSDGSSYHYPEVV